MELRGAPRGPEITDEDAERLLNGVLDAGTNFIDTSIDYGLFHELKSPAQAPYGSAERGSSYQGQRGPQPSRIRLG